MQSKIVRINCQLQLKANEFCSFSLSHSLTLSLSSSFSAYLSFAGLSIVCVCGRLAGRGAAQVGVALCLKSKTPNSNCAQQLEINGRCKKKEQHSRRKRRRRRREIEENKATSALCFNFRFHLASETSQFLPPLHSLSSPIL